MTLVSTPYSTARSESSKMQDRERFDAGDFD
jgi:hypothetical protein